MIDITVTGKSTLLRQFHQYLIDKFGVRKVIADLPDCMKQGVVINKVTASFYVDDNFFDKNNLSEEGFRQLDISVLVNNGLKISKRKYGRIIVYNGQKVQRGGAEHDPHHERMSVVHRPILNFTLEVTLVPVEMVSAQSVLHGDTPDFSSESHQRLCNSDA